MTILHAYLDTAEAAELLGISQRAVYRKIRAHELPAMELSTRIVRVEAVAIDPTAPPPIPADLPPEVTLSFLAKLWRVSLPPLLTLAGSGALPMQQVAGCWFMSRRAFLRFVNDRTTGDGW